jgi:hypothetical protein
MTTAMISPETRAEVRHGVYYYYYTLLLPASDGSRCLVVCDSRNGAIVNEAGLGER